MNCPCCGQPIKTEPTQEDLVAEVFQLLESNNIDVLLLPTIQQLGKLRGGHGLVKRISRCGGLKALRTVYTHYAAQRLYSCHT